MAESAGVSKASPGSLTPQKIQNLLLPPAWWDLCSQTQWRLGQWGWMGTEIGQRTNVEIPS